MIQAPAEWEKLLHALAAPAWLFTIVGVATMAVRAVLWIRASRNGNHGTNDQSLRVSDKVDEGRDRILKEIADTRHALRNDMVKVQTALDDTLTEGFRELREQMKEKAK